MEAQLPDFSAGNWVKLARFAVATSVLLTIVTLGILLFVEAPQQCRSWCLKNHQPLWEILALWGVPITIFNAFIAVRWNWVARRMVEKQQQQVRSLFFGRMTAPYVRPIPVTYIMIPMCAMGSTFAQLPLFLLILECWISQ
jgi:hypothetical protein